jgi:glycosyltransferase involved in cell wall biosynthesis
VRCRIVYQLNLGAILTQLPRVAFIHGRPEPHPFHTLLAESVNSDFYFVDYFMRWHDKDTSKLYRYASMVFCSLLFPKSQNYEALISEGLHTIPVLTKYFTVMRNKPKSIALMADEALYFIKTGFYTGKTHRLLIETLKRFDALICVGEMQAQIAKEIIGEDKVKPQIIKINSSISNKRLNDFRTVLPNLEGKQIIFIANGPSGWRGWYKGIDILLDAVEMVGKEMPDIKLKIIGDWEKDYIEEILQPHPLIKERVNFFGKTQELEKHLSESALYVHIARGEAFGISILEAMCAGVPAIVSEWTGAKEAVVQVDQNLIVSIDAEETAAKILWYFNLSGEEKKILSNKSRKVSHQYREERAIAEFRNAVNKIVENQK